MSPWFVVCKFVREYRRRGCGNVGIALAISKGRWEGWETCRCDANPLRCSPRFSTLYIRPVISIALPFLCRRHALFRLQRFTPGVVRRWLGPLPSRSLFRLWTRLRPNDLFKSNRAALVEHLQLALARLLHGNSPARSQSLIAPRFQLQKTVLETYHQVVGDHPLGLQAKHPLQVQALRQAPMKVRSRRRFADKLGVGFPQILLPRNSGSPPPSRQCPPAASS